MNTQEGLCDSGVSSLWLLSPCIGKRQGGRSAVWMEGVPRWSDPRHCPLALDGTEKLRSFTSSHRMQGSPCLASKAFGGNMVLLLEG